MDLSNDGRDRLHAVQLFLIAKFSSFFRLTSRGSRREMGRAGRGDLLVSRVPAVAESGRVSGSIFVLEARSRHLQQQRNQCPRAGPPSLIGRSIAAVGIISTAMTASVQNTSI